MNTQANTNINIMVDSKEERQKYIDRVEVLDKVGKLFLIPSLEMMTARQISEFYGIEMDTLQSCYQRNKKEIDSDSTTVKKVQDFAEISDSALCTLRKQSRVHVLEFNGVQIIIPNKGVRCFSKRAVLRFGMLLRDSKVAQEVRTQLLNVFENTEVVVPEALTVEIETEKELLNNVAVAFASGDMMKFAEATMKLNAYKDRHIKEIEASNKQLTEENTELTEKNETLADDNAILTGNILEWSNQATANRVVRCMAITLGWNFGSCWNEIYKELDYKHGISLKKRWVKGKRPAKPYLSYLRDDEWDCFYKTIAAMLNARYVNPSTVFKKAKLEYKEE